MHQNLKWTKYCILSAAGADNANANSYDIIFIIKDMKLYVPVVTLSAKYNRNLSIILIKRFKRPVYQSESKTKRENKSTANAYR